MHPLNGAVVTAGLRDAAAQRIAENPGFHFLIAEEEELLELEQRKTVSLRESERRAEWEAREQARLERRNRLRAYRGLPPLASLDDEDDELAENDEEDEEGVERIMLEESANILADHIAAKRPRTAQLN